MKKITLEFSGKTEEGQYVVSGVFKLFDTYGMPLDIITELLYNNSVLVNWYQFISDAKKAGWKNKRIKSAIESAVVDSDCFSRDYIEKMRGRLNNEL